MDDALDAAFEDGFADILSRTILTRMGRDSQAGFSRPIKDRRPFPERHAL